MTSYVTILALIFSLQSANVINPIFIYDHKNEPVIENGVLKGSVSVSKDLPEGFYGTWSVTSKLTYTNNPLLFNPKSSDIWTLNKIGKTVTLTNPATGATSSITIDEVKGNTAKFTRKKITNKRKETETPKITLDGENFYGTDRLVIEHYWRDKLIRTDVVEYEVKGTKISGPTIKDIFAE